MFKNIFKLEPGRISRIKMVPSKQHDTGIQPLVQLQRQKKKPRNRFVSHARFSQAPDDFRATRWRVSFGGIDSTAILGLATEVAQKPLDTFTVGFNIGGDKFNADLRLARETSAYYKTNHHELIISGADVLKHLSM